MADDPKAPCKVYYVRPNGTVKELTANSQAELDVLLRIGWKTEKPTGDEGNQDSHSDASK